MADLLTHYVSARLPGGFLKDPAARTTLILGVFLPDLVSKPIMAIPGVPDYADAPAHSLLGLACLSYAVSMLFSADFRWKAFLTLFAGGAIHVAVDSLKDSMGFGSTIPFHPFSLEGFELGLYYNENIVWFLPANGALLLLIRWASKRARAAGWAWK